MEILLKTVSMCKGHLPSKKLSAFVARHGLNLYFIIFVEIGVSN